MHNWITPKIKINFLYKKNNFFILFDISKRTRWFLAFEANNPKLHTYSDFVKSSNIFEKKKLRILGHYEVMGYQNASKCIYDPLKADDKILL